MATIEVTKEQELEILRRVAKRMIKREGYNLESLERDLPRTAKELGVNAGVLVAVFLPLYKEVFQETVSCLETKAQAIVGEG